MQEEGRICIAMEMRPNKMEIACVVYVVLCVTSCYQTHAHTNEKRRVKKTAHNAKMEYNGENISILPFISQSQFGGVWEKV